MSLGNGSRCDVCERKAIAKLTRRSVRDPRTPMDRIDTRTELACLEHVSHVLMFLTMTDITTGTGLDRRNIDTNDIVIEVKVLAF